MDRGKLSQTKQTHKGKDLQAGVLGFGPSTGVPRQSEARDGYRCSYGKTRKRVGEDGEHGYCHASCTRVEKPSQNILFCTLIKVTGISKAQGAEGVSCANVTKNHILPCSGQS